MDVSVTIWEQEGMGMTVFRKGRRIEWREIKSKIFCGGGIGTRLLPLVKVQDKSLMGLHPSGEGGALL